MQRKSNSSVVVARLAWLATFVLPLLLTGLLLAVSSAPAAPASPATSPLAFESEFEGEEEGEFEENECESAEEELEEGELGQLEVDQLCEEEEREGKDEVAANSSVAPEECLLRSAHAQVVATESHDSVRLTVGYTAYEPTTATVDYLAKGDGASLHLGTARHHLGRSGVIRLSKNLSEVEMARVVAAGRVTVQLHVAGTPGNCRRFETRQLTVKRTPGGRTVWSQPG